MNDFTKEKFIPYPNNLAEMNYTKRSLFLSELKDVKILEQEKNTLTKELDNAAKKNLAKKIFTTLDIDYLIKQFIANYIHENSTDAILMRQKNNDGEEIETHCITKPYDGNNYYTLSFFYEDIFSYACHPEAEPATIRQVKNTFKDFFCKENEKKRIFQSLSNKNEYIFAVPYYTELKFSFRDYQIAGKEEKIQSYDNKIMTLYVHKEIVNGILNEKGYTKSNFYYADKYFSSRAWEFLCKEVNETLREIRRELISANILQIKSGLMQTKKAIKELEKKDALITNNVKLHYLIYWDALNNLESYLPIHINEANTTGKLYINDKEFSTIVSSRFVHKVKNTLQFKNSNKKTEFYNICNKEIFPLFSKMKESGQFPGLRYIPEKIEELKNEELQEQKKKGSNKNAVLFWKREFELSQKKENSAN